MAAEGSYLLLRPRAGYQEVLGGFLLQSGSEQVFQTLRPPSLGASTGRVQLYPGNLTTFLLVFCKQSHGLAMTQDDAGGLLGGVAWCGHTTAAEMCRGQRALSVHPPYPYQPGDALCATSCTPLRPMYGRQCHLHVARSRSACREGQGGKAEGAGDLKGAWEGVGKGGAVGTVDLGAEGEKLSACGTLVQTYVTASRVWPLSQCVQRSLMCSGCC